jgi:guanine nucleotide-binding protein G(i) subunit alpha
MKIIHLNGFSDEERALYRPILHNNVLGAMKQLVLASRRFELEVSESNAEIARQFAEEINPLKMALSAELALKTKVLWEDEAIQAAYAKRSNYQLPDSAAYVLNSVERIAEPDYLPSEEDVLRGRARTTGIIEVSFTCDEVQFRVVDVGGQRSERKKWIHCFQVGAFCVFLLCVCVCVGVFQELCASTVCLLFLLLAG